MEISVCFREAFIITLYADIIVKKKCLKLFQIDFFSCRVAAHLNVYLYTGELDTVSITRFV